MNFKSLILLVVIAPMAACTLTKKSSSTLGGGSNSSLSVPRPSDDGLSYATAIVITEKSELTGPGAEYAWIKNHYNDYKIKGQALTHQGRKSYDIITIILASGKELPLYFDISNFFGKF